MRRFPLLFSFLLLLLISPARWTFAQVSPGPLSKAHGNLNGLNKCTTCHSSGGGAGKFKCVECHTEILQRVQGNKGFHARVVDKSKGGQDCIRCHAEHLGEDFAIIHWEPSREAFDHRQVGYPLQGKHATLECSRCHQPSHLMAADLRALQGRDLQKTYLGLSTQCTSCHQDIHRGQLGENCTSCHTFQSWKEKGGFDHQRTAFPLTGLHQEVPCQKCHLRPENGTLAAKYKGIAFGRCNDCHRDPHQAAFQAACQNCHVTTGWRLVKKLSGFDHQVTAYPLRGLHAEVACAKCHPTSNFSQPIPHAKCMDCHKADPHNGQFARRADSGECGSCHVETGFKPSTFSRENHQKTSYPLTGKHEPVDCVKCHLPKGKDTLFRVKHEACLDCHQDVHENQFTGSTFSNRCDGCHTLQGFQPSTFSVSRHGETRFRLTDAHLAVPCLECHKRPANRFPPPPAQFRFEVVDCQTCHQDPHQGEFQARLKKETHLEGKDGCLGCHTLKSWRETAKFDHQQTSFPLLGAHRVVPCADCHRPDNLGRGVKNVRFSLAPKECGGCHENIHATQFDLNGQPADCAACHEVSKWKPSKFDHEKKARFSLAGAHQTVPCRLCHKATHDVQGRAVLVYHETPRQCAACHADKA
ncbi:MAG: hypothetical protein U0V70_06710 [Terriglobia bacterium]